MQSDRACMSVVEPALNAEKEKETKEKRAIVTAAVTFATGGLGGIYGGLNGALGGGIAGLAGGIIGSNLIFRDHNTVTQWDDIYENEADEQSLHYMIDQGYDVREAPRLYARLGGILPRATASAPLHGLEETRMKARNRAYSDCASATPLRPSGIFKLKVGGPTGIEW